MQIFKPQKKLMPTPQTLIKKLLVGNAIWKKTETIKPITEYHAVCRIYKIF